MRKIIDQLRAEPERFLTMHPIFETQKLMSVVRVPTQGIQSFGFSRRETALNGLWLDVGSNLAFKCYWLPWKSKKTTSILLEDRANYFFTSQLGGCRVVITLKNNRKSAHIIHIAGDGEVIRRGVRWREAHIVWRDQQQQEYMCNLSGFNHRRKITSTASISDSDYSYNREGGNVVGVRAANGQWCFWLQKVNFNTSTVEFVKEIDFYEEESLIDLTEASEEFFYIQSRNVLKSNNLLEPNILEQSPLVQAMVLAAGDYIEKNKSSWFRNSVTYSKKFLSNICCMNSDLEIQREALSFILGTGNYPGNKSSNNDTSRRMLIRSRILQMDLQRQIPVFLSNQLRLAPLYFDDLSNIAVEE